MTGARWRAGRRRAAMIAAATAVAAVAVILSGVLRTPRLVLSGFQVVDADDGSRRLLATRGDLRVIGTRWRPLVVSITLAPSSDAAQRPQGPVAETEIHPDPNLRVVVEGVEPRDYPVAGPQRLQVTLPRLRGVGADDRITLINAREAAPLELQSVSAVPQVVPSWWLTLLYAAALGVGLVVFARRASVAAPPSGDGGWPAAMARPVALIAITLGVAVLRKPDAWWLPQLWAEDGAVFLRDAIAHGARALVEPYSGYHHLYPRIVAEAATWLPRPSIPLIFNLAAAVPLALVAAFLASPRLPIAPVQRLACALILVVPPMPGEVLLNVTNTTWVFGLLLALLLVAAPARRAAAIAFETAGVVLAGLTGPLCVALAPLFALRAAGDRSAGALRQAALVVACAVVQAATLVSRRRFDAGEPLPFDLLLSRLGQRMMDVMSWAPGDEAGFLLASAVLAFLVFCLGVLASAGERLAAMCLAAALVVTMAVLIGVRNLPGALAVPGGRYFSAPLVLLLWSATLVSPRFTRAATIPGGAVLVLGAAAFAVPPLPDRHWSSASICLDGPPPCSVPINPRGWSIDLPAAPDGGLRR